MRYVQGRYIGERDYWKSRDGTRYDHRTGKGVRGNPYRYKWADYANCYQRLLKLLASEYEVRLGFIGHRVLANPDTLFLYKREKLGLLGDIRHPFVTVRFEHLRSGDFCATAHEGEYYGDEIADACHFRTEEEIAAFASAIFDELIRQKLAAPPEKHRYLTA